MVDVNDKEKDLIEKALNFYWNDANEKLTQNYIKMSDGTKRNIGDIERYHLQYILKNTKLLLDKFEYL